MTFPIIRPRRLRQSQNMRKLVQEATLLKKDLIQPLFVKESVSKSVPIASMPGQFQFSFRDLLAEAKHLESIGITAILLFGIPSQKDLTGKIAISSNGILQKAIRAIKKSCPKLLVIADVCLCEYLSHGHCGLVSGNEVMNDATLKVLAKLSQSYAEAGADVLAPSDMMDGRVASIRRQLDSTGFSWLPILSYAVKYQSKFYSPFREIAESAPKFGDRQSYQMNPGNIKEALREAQLDVQEGADMLLVKPALSYLDVVQSVSQNVTVPVGCYSVSGEYAMIKAAAQNGWLDEKDVVLETHLSMKRAGAAFIVTYWAKKLVEWHFAKGCL